MPDVKKAIENDTQEIKANSQAEFEMQEEKMMKQRTRDGWELTGITNPIPFLATYYFLRDNTKKN